MPATREWHPKRLDLEFCPRCSAGPRRLEDVDECPDCGYHWSGPPLRAFLMETKPSKPPEVS